MDTSGCLRQIDQHTEAKEGRPAPSHPLRQRTPTARDLPTNGSASAPAADRDGGPDLHLDEDSSYSAMGEAVNGPGGYFG